MKKKIFCCTLFLLLFAVLPLFANEQLARDKARGIVFSKCGKILIKYPNTLPDREYIVPAGVVVIDQRAFYQCYKLEKIVFPASMRVVRRYAFAHCKNLETLRFPHNMRHIAYGAFFKCTRLRLVELFAGTYVNKYAFPANCRVARYR